MTIIIIIITIINLQKKQTFVLAIFSCAQQEEQKTQMKRGREMNRSKQKQQMLSIFKTSFNRYTLHTTKTRRLFRVFHIKYTFWYCVGLTAFVMCMKGDEAGESSHLSLYCSALKKHLTLMRG